MCGAESRKLILSNAHGARTTCQLQIGHGRATRAERTVGAVAEPHQQPGSQRRTGEEFRLCAPQSGPTDDAAPVPQSRTGAARFSRTRSPPAWCCCSAAANSAGSPLAWACGAPSCGHAQKLARFGDVLPRAAQPSLYVPSWPSRPMMRRSMTLERARNQYPVVIHQSGARTSTGASASTGPGAGASAGPGTSGETGTVEGSVAVGAAKSDGPHGNLLRTRGVTRRMPRRMPLVPYSRCSAPGAECPSEYS